MQDTEDTSGGVETAVADSSPVVDSGAQQPTAAVPQEENYWSHFKGLPEFSGKSDREIAGTLYQTMQREKAAAGTIARMQGVLPHANEWIAHKDEFMAWKKAQAQQAQQSQQAVKEVKKFWNPPEVKESYRRYITRDAEGRDVIAEDAPYEARQALLENMAYQRDFAQKFLSDPEQTLGPLIQQMAEEKAQNLIETTLHRREEQAFVDQITEENKDWLYDSETGNVTPEAIVVHRYVEDARALGIQGAKPRWEYAKAMLTKDLLYAARAEEERRNRSFVEQFQQAAANQPDIAPEPPQPAPQEVAQRNMDYLRKEASRNPSRSSGRGIENGQKPAPPNRSIEQILLDELTKRGLAQ